MTDAAAIDTAAAFTRTLRAEQAAVLCRLSAAVVRTSLLSGLFIAYLLLEDNSFTAVAVWYGTLVAVVLGRDRLQACFLSKPRAAEIHRWSRWLLAGIAANGLVWCVPGTLLLPQDADVRVLITLFLAGLSAVAVASLSPMRHAYTCFLLPFLAPVALRFFTLDRTFVNAAIGVSVYTLAMIAVAYRQSHGVEDMLQLQLENKALAERVQAEKATIERANRDLEGQMRQRERTEAELLIAKGDAEAASRAKTQFLANMSHELRTPLGAILGMSDLLLRSTQDQKQLKHLRIVRNGGERLLRIVTDILDLSRIEAGAMRFDNVAFSPSRLVHEVTDFMSELSRSKGLALTARIGADVPDQVRGDPGRVKQMLTNLVDNAIKFTEAGGIEIRLERVAAAPREATTPRRTELRWSVHDTGVGIPEAERERLFRPFSQIDQSRTRRFGGTGLGLAICRQFVTALGGRIDVESTTGGGSTFWFELPFEEIEHPGQIDLNETASRQFRLNGHVLVVDDNQVNRELVAEVLEHCGCSVAVAANGVDALNQVGRTRFDLVLMDLHMPEMDGLTATRRLRASEQTAPARRLPVVALTASVMAEDRQACTEAGMDDFIAKPFTHRELIATLQRWLQQREPAAARPAVQ